MNTLLDRACGLWNGLIVAVLVGPAARIRQIAQDAGIFQGAAEATATVAAARRLRVGGAGLDTLLRHCEGLATDDTEAIRTVHTALDLGMNFIDTSPYYGRGMSEIMLGLGLKGIPRDKYLLGTKLGRYSDIHFDFSAKRVEESLHVSLQRLGTDYLDVLLLHDVEFVPLPQIWEETLPAVLKLKEQGKVRAVGFSCYPLKTFHTVLDHVEDEIDCVLSYNRYTLQN